MTHCSPTADGDAAAAPGHGENSAPRSFAQPTCQLRLEGCTLVATHVDHVIPRSLRPDLTMVRANLRGSCRSCNLKRGNKIQLTTTATPMRSDLRPARQAKNITLATVATHFGIPLITVSRLERGHQRNDTLANNYRQWLTAA